MLLSQYLPPPRYTNGSWVNVILGLTLQQTGIPFKTEGEVEKYLSIDAAEIGIRC